MAIALTDQGVQFPQGMQYVAAQAGIVGMISMFDAGSTLPAGWYVCDGTTAGVPDLRSRFLVASGLRFSPGLAGGSESITLANLPSHDHGGSTQAENQQHIHSMSANPAYINSTNTGPGGAHSHGVSDPGHTHGYMGGQGGSSWQNGGPLGGPSSQTTSASGTGIGIQGVGDHTHTFSGSGITINANTGGENVTHYHGIPASGSGAAYYQPYYAVILAKFLGT